MNWDAIGAIGETVGALAVFLTLIYLAIQIRQNTKAVKAAAIDSTNSQVSRIRELIIANADVAIPPQLLVYIGLLSWMTYAK